MRVDTPMRIASGSKIITSVMAMQCVERGIVGLDESVKRLLPEVGDMKVLKGLNAAAEPELREHERAVTLR